MSPVGTGIQDEDLATVSALQSLEYLYLDHTDVTEAGLVYLQDLPNLRLVTVNHTEISEEAANAFNDSLSED